MISDVSVAAGGQRGYGNAAAAAVDPGVWRRLEALLVESEAPSANWLDGLKQVGRGML